MECGKGTKRGKGGARKKGGELKYAKVEWVSFMFCVTEIIHVHRRKAHREYGGCMPNLILDLWTTGLTSHFLSCRSNHKETWVLCTSHCRHTTCSVRPWI